MKRKILLGSVLCVAVAGGILFAADHIDAPAVTGANSASLGSDITDVYAFQSPSDNSKMVFVMNVQGLMSPAASATATFPSNTLYEINIDNTGDNVEDLVIQAIVQNGKIRTYGPVAPAATGISSTVVTTGPVAEAGVTGYASSAAPVVGTNTQGIKVFAGPRDDPFFFDLTRFKEIIGGTQTSFRNPGVDTFAGTNVMSIVVEVPKSLLGTAGTINVWGETKTK
ncbi:MAG TPA: DUF4331 family protein [Flavisolibacter sp.]|jgi:hypothetical protein|nr:DUF4331 family protein [Flavisolibacter sp.]